MSANNDERSGSESERNRGVQNSSSEQIFTDLDKSESCDAEIMQLMSSRNSSTTQDIYEDENGTPIGDVVHGLGATLWQTSVEEQGSSDDENSISEKGTKCSREKETSLKSKAEQAESPDLTGERNELLRGVKGPPDAVNNTRTITNKGRKHRTKTDKKSAEGGRSKLQNGKGWSAQYVHKDKAKHTSETVQAESSLKGKMKKKKNIKDSEKRKIDPTVKELHSQARKLAACPLLFRAFQQKMGEWITQNYGRIIDIFRRFDKDQSGTISYDEFFNGMTALGAPTTKAEMYVMANTLDADNDNAIDYKEFAKLRRQYRAASGSFKKTADLPSADSPSMTQVQLLQPCPRCEVGIWEPVDEDMPRFVCLNLEWSSPQDHESYPQRFCVKVQSEISIYGVSRLVKKELGHCVTNITIYRPLEGGENELLSPEKKLSDYGYSGTLPPESPQEVTMLYDYEYPFLDCPLLLADLQLTRRKDKERDEGKTNVTQAETVPSSDGSVSVETNI